MKKVLGIISVLFILTGIVSMAAGKWVLSESATWGAITPTNSAIKYGGTLRLGEQGIVNNFNPFLITSDGARSLVYEPLFYINPLNGQKTPLLGTNYKWENNDHELIVKIRSGVKWSDGVPFTANDVAFTFNLMKKYPALDFNGIWSSVSGLQSVEVSGTNTVVFKFFKPNIAELFYILRTFIVPEHIWAKIANPVTFDNSGNPIGTGPFLRASYSVSGGTEIYKKNPDYWLKGRPYINEIKYINSSNQQTGFLQLRKGEIFETNIPPMDPMKTWVSLDPQNNKMYWPVYNVNVLYMNTQKVPFNNSIFRKAITLAINKSFLERAAYFGIGGESNQTGVIPPQQNEWLDPSLEASISYFKYNPKKAQELLASIGYKKNASGKLIGPDGKELRTFNFPIGAGWIDYMTMAQIISKELKNIGITVNIHQGNWSSYVASLLSGKYDMAIGAFPTTGPTPFYGYYSSFNPAFSAPAGKNAVSDVARYTNPKITQALNEYTTSSDLSVQKHAMYTIEKIMLKDVPLVVLTNRTGFGLYSTKRFVGWPSDSNPYELGLSMTNLGLEILSLNLHLK